MYIDIYLLWSHEKHTYDGALVFVSDQQHVYHIESMRMWLLDLAFVCGFEGASSSIHRSDWFIYCLHSVENIKFLDIHDSF